MAKKQLKELILFKRYYFVLFMKYQHTTMQHAPNKKQMHFHLCYMRKIVLQIEFLSNLIVMYASFRDDLV